MDLRTLIENAMAKWGPSHDVAACHAYVCADCAIEACRFDILQALQEADD